MNVYSILSIMACTIYLCIGAQTFRTYKKTALGRIFMLICLALAVWSFGYAFVYAGDDASSLWMKVSALGWCTFSALILHITVTFLDIRTFRKIIPQALLYLPSVVFLYMSLFLFGPGKQPAAGISDFFYIGDFLYDLIYPLAAITLLIRKRKVSKLARRRKQLKWIVFCGSIPLALNLTTQFLLPLAGINLPLMGQLYALITVCGIYYANLRYGLFEIPFGILYEEILTEMMDLFFLLSPEGKIQKVNGRTIEHLGYSQEELEGRRLAELCKERNTLEFILACDGSSSAPACAELHCLHQSGKEIPMRLSCSRLKEPGSNEVLGIMVIGQDISLRRRLEEEMRIQLRYEKKLRESEERFRAMFDKHSAVMCLFDPETLHILAVNQAALDFYGYSLAEFETMSTADLNAGGGQEEAGNENPMDGSKLLLHLKHRLANGDIRDVEVHSAAVPFGSRSVIYSIIHDITERKKAEEYISFLAYNDSLTGLANRKLFHEQVEKALSAAGQANSSFAVMYIDMDDLKTINDTYGHENGDRVLREFGKRMAEATPEGDVAARLGGDEFAILLRNIATVPEARLAAQAIGRHLMRPIPMAGMEYTVHASIGVSLFPDDGGDVETLLKQADSNMYSVKRERKNAAHS